MDMGGGFGGFVMPSGGGDVGKGLGWGCLLLFWVVMAMIVVGLFVLAIYAVQDVAVTGG